MKKFVCLFSLALLCSTSLSAQTVDTSLSKGKAPITEEDVQTIFFSEDLLDELSNIPTAPLLEDEPSLPTSSSAPEVQNPTVQTPNISHTESSDSNLAPQQKNIPQSLSEEKNIPSETQAPIINKTTTADETVPVVINENKVDAPQKQSTPPLPKEAPLPIVSEKVKEVSSPQPNTNLKQDVLPQTNKTMPQTSEEKILPAQKTAPDLKNIPLEKNEMDKPTIQEQIELPKISFPRQPVEEPKPQQPAPEPQKKNAFSLDDKAPLPASLLQDDGLSTSVIDRGIRISPEQRAKMMMKKKYDEMDINHDGIVSRDEFVTYKTLEAQRIAEQVFDQIDTNADAIISDDEYDILMNKMIENYIKPPRRK